MAEQRPPSSGKSSPARQQSGRSTPEPPRTFDVDDDAEPADEGYETAAADAGSNASVSLSSSVRDYNFENKRRYHKFKEGRYLLPNDDIEQEREDMKHAMVVHLCEGLLHNAPLDRPQKILDIGTGTGIWAIDSTSGPIERWDAVVWSG